MKVDLSCWMIFQILLDGTLRECAIVIALWELILLRNYSSSSSEATGEGWHRGLLSRNYIGCFGGVDINHQMDTLWPTFSDYIHSRRWPWETLFWRNYIHLRIYCLSSSGILSFSIFKLSILKIFPADVGHGQRRFSILKDSSSFAPLLSPYLQSILYFQWIVDRDLLVCTKALLAHDAFRDFDLCLCLLNKVLLILSARRAFRFSNNVEHHQGKWPWNSSSRKHKSVRQQYTTHEVSVFSMLMIFRSKHQLCSAFRSNIQGIMVNNDTREAPVHGRDISVDFCRLSHHIMARGRTCVKMMRCPGLGSWKRRACRPWPKPSGLPSFGGPSAKELMGISWCHFYIGGSSLFHSSIPHERKSFESTLRLRTTFSRHRIVTACGRLSTCRLYSSLYCGQGVAT